MKAFFLFIALSLIVAESYAQISQELVGTWHAKPYVEPKNRSKATIYLRELLAGARESLLIDSSLHYTYQQWYTGDTLTNKGTVSIQGDTLIFIQNHTTSKNVHAQDTIKLFLYYTGSTQFIHSYYQLPKRPNKPTPEQDEASRVFSKVEVDAEYKPGNNAFYKTIYQNLAKNTQPSTTTVLLEYRIIIDTSGKAETGSLEAKNEISKQYLTTIADAIKKLEGDFSPARQNARKVRSYFEFQITY